MIRVVVVKDVGDYIYFVLRSRVRAGFKACGCRFWYGFLAFGRVGVAAGLGYIEEIWMSKRLMDLLRDFKETEGFGKVLGVLEGFLDWILG